MACDTVAQPLLELMSTAYMLAGKSNSGILTDVEAKKALLFLNLILKDFSGRPNYISYMNLLKFEGLGNDATEYRIGRGAEANIIASPPTEISHATYDMGNNTFPIDYLPPDSFDNIVYKKNITMPIYWTYELRKDYTLVRFWPTPSKSLIMSLRCLQRWDDVKYFTSESEIPDKNQLFLTYELANYLVDINVGNPQANFYNNLEKLRAGFKISNQADFQKTQRSSPRSIKMVGSSRRGRTSNGARW